jgi:membrane associated rhomboid family serine protease
MHFNWQVNSGSISILVITLLMSLYGLLFNGEFLENCMLHPYSIARKTKLYTLVTSGFIHANFGHLLFNMLTYYFFCFTLERVYIGTFDFIVLYMVALVLCDVPTIIKNRNNPGYYSLGASGAISAVLFCWIIYNPVSEIGFILLPFGIPAWIFGPLYLIYCTYAGSRQWGNINHDAHFYGAIIGIAMAFLLNYSEAHEIFNKILYRIG